MELGPSFATYSSSGMMMMKISSPWQTNNPTCMQFASYTDFGSGNGNIPLRVEKCGLDSTQFLSESSEGGGVYRLSNSNQTLFVFVVAVVIVFVIVAG